ncbi:MAG TPA: RDD family protein [Rhodanobacteraceae bacterium]|nr:RDD family protein [Rhodanobacteraceae bacterium]
MSTSSVSTIETTPPRLWRRFAAMLYDLFPLIGLWIIGSAVWMLAFHRGDNLQQLASAVRDPLDLALRDLWLLILAAAYFVASWTRVGATIGMRAWKLKLVRGDGARIGFRIALLRFVLASLSLVILGCGFWYAWFDADRRTWHDRVCGTRMMRL